MSDNVRSGLEETPARESRLWKFLNSAFALWLLSTVAVGGLSTALTYYSATQDSAKSRKLSEEKLYVELSNRFSTIAMTTKLAKNTEELYYYLTTFLSNQNFSGAIFPEYERFKVTALLEQLRIVRELEDQRTLKNSMRIREVYEDLSNTLFTLDKYGISKTAEIPKELKEKMKSEIDEINFAELPKLFSH
jgi:hypothetical protein